MTRDFTLSKYKELLQQLPTGNYTFRESLINGNQFGIIRHDVDRPPYNVLQLAKIEHDFGIKTTYFFRIKEKHFVPEIINQVKLLGHEIGYHYEVLDKANGNMENAIEIFVKEWSLFKTWDSETICMHGNPFSKFINNNIWSKYNFKDYNVLGEGYLSVDFSKYNYFTDTGRKWNYNSYSMKDKINIKLTKINSTNDLISKLKQGEIDHIYILTHPSRWNDNLLFWSRELIFQSLKNIIKSQLNLIKNKKR
jgi:hypothetical protein